MVPSLRVGEFRYRTRVSAQCCFLQTYDTWLRITTFSVAEYTPSISSVKKNVGVLANDREFSVFRWEKAVILFGHRLTRKVSAAGEESLDVILVEAIVLQHSVELLQILNVTLECYLLLPAACGTQIFKR